MTNHIGEATNMVRKFIAALRGPVVFAGGLVLLAGGVIALETSMLLSFVFVFLGAMVLGLDAYARSERARAEGFRDAILMLASNGDLTITVVHTSSAQKPEVRE